MDLYRQRCAGIDIGKVDVKVCVRTPADRAGSRREQIRTFATTTASLLQLRDWLLAEEVELVGMESTGVYWKPVFYLLEEACECWLLNPQHVKKVPGRKSDVSDAAWLAQLVECGLVRAGFVPPDPIRQLRDLTRYRSSLTAERTREANRLHKVLEDAGIKLDCVVSDILGASGRDMIAALIDGCGDPGELAELARTKMRVKIPALREALTGRFNDHHGRLCRLMLDHIDALDFTIDALTTQIHEQMEPYRDDITRLRTIPGVGQRVAEIIIAETGADMTRFPTPENLSSWAGVCPGNNESAGKHFSGRTRHGNHWLAAALGEAATSAARTRNTYLHTRYHHIAGRRGRKRAVVACARIILESAWHILTDHTDYADPGPQHHLRHTAHPEQRIHRLINQIRALGYQATITPAT